jgi:hypothetical protein
VNELMRRVGPALTFRAEIEELTAHLAALSAAGYDEIRNLTESLVHDCAKRNIDPRPLLEDVQKLTLAGRGTPKQLLAGYHAGGLAVRETVVQLDAAADVQNPALLLTGDSWLRSGTRSLPRYVLLELLGEVVSGRISEPYAMDVWIIAALGGMPDATSWSMERRVRELSDRILNRARYDRVLDHHGNVLPPWRWRRPRSPHYPWPNPKETR